MKWHEMTSDEVIKALRSSPKGITEPEASKRMETYGKNSLEHGKKPSFLKKLLLSFTDTMTVVLFIAAVVSFTVSKIQGENAIDSFIILGVVLLNGIISVIQENKAEKSLEALKKLTSPHVSAIRNGAKESIASELLVPGDVVFLQKGDFVPADCRILSEAGLMCDESSLTGESLGVYKSPDKIKGCNDSHISSISNMLWSSTSIVAGHCNAIVCNTGMNSYVGSIAKMITKAGENSKTPLQKRLAKTCAVLGNGALVICLLLFITAVIKGFDPADMFLTSVSLAVAAIPEGLPATVTIMLSLGVTKMAKRKAIVRHLPAVETLGCTTVICSDKTGTLTKNKMSVCETYGNTEALSRVFLYNNDSSSPTEKALFEFAAENFKGEIPHRVGEIPFSSETKYMATLHKTDSGYIATVKGGIEYAGKFISGISPDAHSKASEMAGKGLRVICAGYAMLKEKPISLDKVKYTFAGLAGISDPPRDGVFDAVQCCKTAGIKVVMITGDHKDTALAIAKQIGICGKDGVAFTQKELEAMDADQMKKSISACSVFARTTPEFKLKIVETLQEQGETVAMTGDGVNDAPALKKSDVGCAMGISGTDVAKESGDIILTDDNFKTIVAAVEYGRGIYANIKRAVHFLISCNIGEIITMFVAILLSLPSPLTAPQLLWVNLVTDSLPAVALGFEKPHKGVMKQKPINSKSGLIGPLDTLYIIIEGMMIGGVALAAHFSGAKISPQTADTMCFAVLALSQLFHAYGMRHERPVIKAGLFSNPMLVLALAASVALLAAVMFIPALQGIFGVVSIEPNQWKQVILLSVAPFVLCEVRKILSSLHGGNAGSSKL